MAPGSICLRNSAMTTQKSFRGRAHRGSHTNHRERVASRQSRRHSLALCCMMPAEECDACDEERYAEHGPQQQMRRGSVADQRIVRPVVGVADVLAWPV